MDEEKRNAYRILVGKLEGKRPLGNARRRWVEGVKMNPREIGWGGVVGSCECGNKPSASIKCREALE
jgi:hypothetical protein